MHDRFPLSVTFQNIIITSVFSTVFRIQWTALWGPRAITLGLCNVRPAMALTLEISALD